MEWIESLNPWWVLSISTFVVILLILYILSLRTRIKYLNDVSREESLLKQIKELEREKDKFMIEATERKLEDYLVREVLPRLSNSELDSISRACGITKMKYEGTENEKAHNLMLDYWVKELQKLIKEKADLR